MTTWLELSRRGGVFPGPTRAFSLFTIKRQQSWLMAVLDVLKKAAPCGD